MSEDLIAFVRARLDEEEAAAKNCADSSGNLSWSDCTVMASGDHTIRTVPGNRPVARVRLADSAARDGRTLNPVACANHIARHDPARVLRDIEADRKLLAAYQKTLSLPPGRDPQVEGEDEIGWRLALEFAIKLRAARFSDHPDYDQGWKP